jgi:secreted trypsin-like serine protease
MAGTDGGQSRKSKHPGLVHLLADIEDFAQQEFCGVQSRSENVQYVCANSLRLSAEDGNYEPGLAGVLASEIGARCAIRR